MTVARSEPSTARASASSLEGVLADRTQRPTKELRLERVSRWFGDVIALNDVDLAIGPGVNGLLGPNGAGKTTLIRLVVGLATPGEGRVLLDGQPVRNNRAALARIGYVADGDGLYDELTARRFVTDQALMRGFPAAAARARAEEILVRVGLGDALDRRAGGFSKGMRQRLKLAQAIIHDPDVLVLDEPLTGLDPIMRRDFTRIVRELGELGVIVLVSSHVLHEVEAMTDNIVLMRHGQVLAEGTVSDIRDHIDTEPRRMRLSVADPRALARQLLEYEGLVEGLAFVGDALVVETRDQAGLCERLTAETAAGRLDLTAIEPLDEDLQSVFSYLVS